MKNDSQHQNLSKSTPTKHSMGRREMVRRLLGGAGLGYAAPLVAASHPIHRHLADPATLAHADAQAAELNWKPLFLDPHQAATLAVIAERIVPGSAEAKVTPFVDLLLSVDTQENQKKFLASLGAFEAEAIRQYGKPYKDISEARQNDLLAAASARHDAAKAAGASDKLDLHGHFENLKGWVSGAYYSSEVGMKELGWTGQVIFADFPGCRHPEGHH